MEWSVQPLLTAARTASPPPTQARDVAQSKWAGDLGISTQRSHGVTHLRRRRVVHERLPASTTVGRTDVNPESAVSRVGRPADTLPTQSQGHDR